MYNNCKFYFCTWHTQLLQSVLPTQKHCKNMSKSNISTFLIIYALKNGVIVDSWQHWFSGKQKQKNVGEEPFFYQEKSYFTVFLLLKIDSHKFFCLLSNKILRNKNFLNLSQSRKTDFPSLICTTIRLFVKLLAKQQKK